MVQVGAPEADENSQVSESSAGVGVVQVPGGGGVSASPLAPPKSTTELNAGS